VVVTKPQFLSSDKVMAGGGIGGHCRGVGAVIDRLAGATRQSGSCRAIRLEGHRVLVDGKVRGDGHRLGYVGHRQRVGRGGDETASPRPIDKMIVAGAKAPIAEALPP